jgi:peptidoglycan/xylan/chitin deacetylase (PgdA/CDA1 family)
MSETVGLSPSEATGSVINVCFHGIGTPGRELEPGEAPYWISVDTYHRVLDDLAGWPTVRISFDDGNASDVEIGLPGLLARGLVADFFVLAGRLGQPGSLDEPAVKELVAAGMTVGTHGMNHIPWRGLDPATTRAELVDARARIAAVTGTPVDAAACPLGRYDRRLLGDLRRFGYRRVYTSDRRAADPNAWLQPRFSIRAEDTPESFRARATAVPALPARAKDAAKGLIKRWR